MSRIYLDHNASTPVRPEVLEAMLPYFGEHFGNASSVHAFGQEAKGAVEDARAQVAALLNATPGEIVFTSGGTESDNIGVIGGAKALPFKGRHIIVSAIEHDAVRHAADALEREGYTVTRVAPDARGVVSAESVAAAIRPDTALVSVMAANNETGVAQPVAEIGQVCASRGVAFHVDAVQAAGKIPIDVQAWQATLATIAGHKFYGPKGVGALYVKRGFKPVPLQFGGEHEKGRRPGTENVPAIVGLGKASELAREELDQNGPRIGRLRDRLETGLLERVPGVVRHGQGAPRVPNTSHLSFVGAEGEHLILSLDMKGVAVSSGAACKAGSSHPSHVLLAMGVPREIAQAAVRFSLGRCSTEQEIDRVLEIVPAVVQKLRAASPAAAS
ncbi:MAG: cysteine desulfurase [Candidatus Eisenbacteria bacterium]|uniref:Cysteine desulfurase n=1 Tax=Eiseniibacteriota bacterium TaxID=2212470 RepID=A0A538TDB0_UNCEI|nr:MAG: cysteine desulfurase [Candidatus Eisenbacteria bacterium]